MSTPSSPLGSSSPLASLIGAGGVLLTLIGLMGYGAWSYAQFVEPGCRPPACQPGGTTIPGGITVNNNNSYTTNNFGIGTDTPGAKLGVKGDAGQDIARFYTSDGSQKVTIDENGRLGLGGIVNPLSELDMNGSLTMRGSAQPANPPAGAGSIYFDGTQFRVYQNGAWSNLGTGGGTGGSVVMTPTVALTVNANADVILTEGSDAVVATTTIVKDTLHAGSKVFLSYTGEAWNGNGCSSRYWFKIDGSKVGPGINGWVSSVPAAQSASFTYLHDVSLPTDRDIVVQVVAQGKRDYPATCSGAPIAAANVNSTGVFQVVEEGVTGSGQTVASGISGGSANYLPKWTGSDTVSTSGVYDNGSFIGIGTNAPASKLHVKDGQTWGSDIAVDATGLAGGHRWMMIATGGTASEGQGHFLIKDATAVNGVRLDIDGNGNVTIPGQIKIQGGNPGMGKVLTSDANGFASWQTPAGGSGGGAGDVMYLRGVQGGKPTSCPVASGWVEADYRVEAVDVGAINYVRTCFNTNKVCSVMYLRGVQGGEPTSCPVASGWVEADYKSEQVANGANNLVRTCYVCN